MATQTRFKGQFVKKKVLDKKLKAVYAMCRANAAKREESGHNLHDRQQEFAVEGRRIVDLEYLAQQLKCIRCKKDILLKKAVKETRMGLNSILHIACDECCSITQVRTGKTHVTLENKTHADVNTKAVLGAVHSGIGETALNKLLNCLNIPTIGSHVFKKYEREIGPALEAAAKDSCRRAAEEEKKLVIENMERLCQEL
ncbi:uncharacterized protein LOC124293697 [Neodiprion lecontei]|uniref:Uncharacterized protein LOC124293697 n=1 Tax=Neodiprion lecontei TaxID=441921 RepID=A0ABM3FUH9_NEOLC|nr:uncharacterized protein LOC124215113 [Neodiprion pinetum]XP_046591676.1 uncharacterized protein LOC124293697 [Neodiprion lecontei]